MRCYFDEFYHPPKVDEAETGPDLLTVDILIISQEEKRSGKQPTHRRLGLVSEVATLMGLGTQLSMTQCSGCKVSMGQTIPGKGIRGFGYFANKILVLLLPSLRSCYPIYGLLFALA